MRALPPPRLPARRGGAPLPRGQVLRPGPAPRLRAADAVHRALPRDGRGRAAVAGDARAPGRHRGRVRLAAAAASGWRGGAGGAGAALITMLAVASTAADSLDNAKLDQASHPLHVPRCHSRVGCVHPRSSQPVFVIQPRGAGPGRTPAVSRIHIQVSMRSASRGRSVVRSRTGRGFPRSRVVSQPRLDTAVAPAGDVQGVELHESAAAGGGGALRRPGGAAARGGSQGLRRRVVGAEDVLAVVCGRRGAGVVELEVGAGAPRRTPPWRPSRGGSSPGGRR